MSVPEVRPNRLVLVRRKIPFRAGRVTWEIQCTGAKSRQHAWLARGSKATMYRLRTRLLTTGLYDPKFPMTACVVCGAPLNAHITGTIKT